MLIGHIVTLILPVVMVWQSAIYDARLAALAPTGPEGPVSNALAAGMAAQTDRPQLQHSASSGDEDEQDSLPVHYQVRHSIEPWWR